MMIDNIVSKNIDTKPENISIVSITNFLSNTHHYRNLTERYFSYYIMDITITQDKGNAVHTLLYIDTVRIFNHYNQHFHTYTKL